MVLLHQDGVCQLQMTVRRVNGPAKMVRDALITDMFVMVIYTAQMDQMRNLHCVKVGMSLVGRTSGGVTIDTVLVWIKFVINGFIAKIGLLVALMKM